MLESDPKKEKFGIVAKKRACAALDVLVLGSEAF